MMSRAAKIVHVLVVDAHVALVSTKRDHSRLEHEMVNAELVRVVTLHEVSWSVPFFTRRWSTMSWKRSSQGFTASTTKLVSTDAGGATAVTVSLPGLRRGADNMLTWTLVREDASEDIATVFVDYHAWPHLAATPGYAGPRACPCAEGTECHVVRW